MTHAALRNEGKNCQNICALLASYLFGTRGAADGWQEECSTTLAELGFIQGMALACVFVHEERGLVCTVHGNGFATVGGKLSMAWFEWGLKEHYERTVCPRLGPGDQDAKAAIILDREVGKTPGGLEYGAGPQS